MRAMCIVFSVHASSQELDKMHGLKFSKNVKLDSKESINCIKIYTRVDKMSWTIIIFLSHMVILNKWACS